MMYYTIFNTKLCKIILAGDESGLKHLHLNTSEGKRSFELLPGWQQNDEFFKDTIRQLTEYLDGGRIDFNLKLSPEGTDFQKLVWAQLRKIPYGEIRSYGEIAQAIGNKNSARAVGMANSRNPIPIIIPCHRVIGSDGRLTGFAHGLEIKRRLIELESNK